MVIYISSPISGQFYFGISIEYTDVLFFIQIAVSVSFNQEDQPTYSYCELLMYLELFLIFYLSSFSFAFYCLLFKAFLPSTELNKFSILFPIPSAGLKSTHCISTILVMAYFFSLYVFNYSLFKRSLKFIYILIFLLNMMWTLTCYTFPLNKTPPYI